VSTGARGLGRAKGKKNNRKTGGIWYIYTHYSSKNTFLYLSKMPLKGLLRYNNV